MLKLRFFSLIAFTIFLLWGLLVQDPYPYFGVLLGEWMHIVGFFALCILCYFTFHQSNPFSITIWVSLFSMLLEVMQPLIQPIRQFETSDLLLNLLGIFLAYAVWKIFQKYHSRQDDH